MGDPLSVAASVAGLLTIASASSKLFIGIARRVKEAPIECERVSRELDDIHGVLSQLQLLILGSSQPSRSRASLIMADQVVALLASCVTTFSDMDELAAVFDSATQKGTLDRIRWIAKKKELNQVLSRLQMNKISINLLLTILTCQKQNEAEAKIDRLCELVEQSLERNEFLFQRLVVDKPAVTSLPEKREGIIANHKSAQFTVSTASQAKLTQQDIGNSAFEDLLNRSRVYRRARARNEDVTSLMSASTRVSMLSGLSLSEVSNVAFMSLPIYATDIHNAHSYAFDTNLKSAEENVLSESRISLHQDKTPIDLSKDSDIKIRSIPRTDRGPQTEICITVENNSNSTYQRSQLFGAPLSKAAEYAGSRIAIKNSRGRPSAYGSIPFLVGAVVTYIREKGLKTPGLFTVSGHNARVTRLERIFELHFHFRKADSFDWTNFTVHDAATVLVRYLKALPEPIIPYEFYDRLTKPSTPFLGALDNVSFRGLSPSGQGILISYIQTVLDQLPRSNGLVLLYLLGFLHLLSGFAEDSHLESIRLVSLFQPSLLSQQQNDMRDIDRYLAARTMVFMIENIRKFSVRIVEFKTLTRDV